MSKEDLFKLVEAGNHDEVAKFLQNCGRTPVELVPKKGVDPVNYTTDNPVNLSDGQGNTALFKAILVDTRMVELILKYGGNPNHDNSDKDTPLSVAAERGAREMKHALLHAGAQLIPAVLNLSDQMGYTTEKEVEQYARTGFCLAPLVFLLSEDVYIRTSDPLQTAFDVIASISVTLSQRNEFRKEIKQLIKEAESFTYRYIDNCDRLWQAKVILGHPANLLEKAIDNKRKQMIAHPFCQQIITERWSGPKTYKLPAGRAKIWIQYFTSPIMLPLLFLKYLLFDMCRGIPLIKSQFCQLLKLISIPEFCFITDCINYVIFFVVLVVMTCVVPFHHDFDYNYESPTATYDRVSPTSYHISPIEYLLYFCVISRYIIEIDNIVQEGVKRYVSLMWSYVDWIVLILLTAAAALKIFGCSTEDYLGQLEAIHADGDPDREAFEEIESKIQYRHVITMHVSYLYAVAEFILSIRILALLEVSKLFGPMLIALKHLIGDVIRFAVLLISCVLGVSVAIFSVRVALGQWVEELKVIYNTNRSYKDWSYSRFPEYIEIPVIMETFSSCATNLILGIFGMMTFNMQNESLQEYESSTIRFIQVLIALYALLCCIFLLNMLIGIMSNTFNRISDNFSVEWHFAQAQLLMEYQDTQPLLIPFSSICFPFIIWYRRQVREQVRARNETRSAEYEGERVLLLEMLCERFTLTTTCGDNMNTRAVNRLTQNRGSLGQRITKQLKTTLKPGLARSTIIDMDI